MLTFSRIRLVELIDDKTIYRYHHSDNENVLRASKPSAHGLAMKLAFVRFVYRWITEQMEHEKSR